MESAPPAVQTRDLSAQVGVLRLEVRPDARLLRPCVVQQTLRSYSQENQLSNGAPTSRDRTLRLLRTAR
jgi:hypothetical protein